MMILTTTCCKHGIELNKLNCLLCYPDATNYCKCNNEGYCELCKIYKPLTSNINKCLIEICKKNGYDTAFMKL